MENKYSETQYAIIREIYTTIKALGGQSDILSIIGSWGDTLDDEEVLQMLKAHNE